MNKCDAQVNQEYITLTARTLDVLGISGKQKAAVVPVESLGFTHITRAALTGSMETPPETQRLTKEGSGLCTIL